MKCENCKWFDKSIRRKYPPTVISTTTVDPHFGHILETETKWPSVESEEFCGKWEPK